MDDDDSDVIFEGSPLHDHLKSVGLVNYEVVEKLSNEKHSFDYYARVKEGILTVKNLINLSFVETFLCGDSAKKYQEFCIKMYDVILESSLLTATDRMILEDFSLSCPAYKHVFSQSLYGYTCVVVLLVGYCFSRFMNEREAHSRATETIFVAGLMLATSALVIKVVLFLVSLVTTSRVLRDFRDALDVFANTKTLIKKGIRNVQEAELIARGFTLVSVSNPVSRLEKSNLPLRSPGQQCPEYRKFLWNAIRTSFLKYRDATLDLLDSRPHLREVDVPSFYVACIPLREFAPIFDDVSEESRDFSVSLLKEAFQLMDLQLSELLRRTGLSFLPLSTDKSIFSSVKIWKHRYKPLMNASRELIEQLARFQLLHKKIDTPITRGKSKPSQQTDLEKFQLAIHSLSLHLRAIILRIQKVDDDDGSTCETLDTLMSEARAELDAGHVCLEEAALHLAAMKGLKPNVNSQPPLPPLILPQTAEGSKVNPIPLFEADDPVVMDQVFEASTLGSNDPEEMEYFEADIFIGEKERLKAEREASKHLYKELKSVLVTKAEEHRVREARALGIATPETQTNCQDYRTINEGMSGDASASTESVSEEWVPLDAGSFSLAASVAAQAALRSRILGCKVDTIGDEDTLSEDSN